MTDLVNPGALVGEARAWGRVRSDREFLAGVSVRVRTEHQRIDSTATLTLYESGRPDPLRESRRSTRDYDDDSWQIFPFDSIPDSTDKEYRFALETDAEHEGISVASATDQPVDCRPQYSPELADLLDPWLARDRRQLPPVPARLQRYLDRLLYECVNQRGYVFLELAHLADAVGRLPERARDVLWIGAGSGYPEAFLAGRLPDANFLSAGVEPPAVEFPMPNLRFGQPDGQPPPGAGAYDLVLSIEGLQQVEDHRGAFRRHAAHVKPRKYLYVSAPFASREEQQDPELRRAALAFGHHTPGFAFEQLEELFEANGLEVLHASSMFHSDVVLPLRRIVERMSSAELECGVAAIARLLLLDLRSDRAASSKQAEGIRFLGRKRDG